MQVRGFTYSICSLVMQCMILLEWAVGYIRILNDYLWGPLLNMVANDHISTSVNPQWTDCPVPFEATTQRLPAQTIPVFLDSCETKSWASGQIWERILNFPLHGWNWWFRDWGATFPVSFNNRVYGFKIHGAASLQRQTTKLKMPIFASLPGLLRAGIYQERKTGP